tara:strand:- start:266 stop:763 length:498 start_codon:yes stop_codon:yes gene_type:complete
MIIMARAGRNQVGPFRKWWNSQSNNHFQIIGLISFISLASFFWTVTFLFILGGASDSDKSHLVPYHWLGLIASISVLFFVLPELEYFLRQRRTLEDILNLDSRSEVIRSRKEAETAADLLGDRYRARLKGLYEELGIKVKGKKYAMKSLPPKRKKFPVANQEEEE